MPEIIKRFINIIIPPRPTERVVGDLSLDYVRSLQTPEGLPYRDEEVKALVWELKYRANAHAARLAGALLADELLAIASEEIGKPLLIPAPMHASRRAARGHNQTELLCEAALKNLGQVFEYMPDVLIRTVNTPTQQGLARHKRLKNVHGSMEVVDAEKIKGRVCVVVDDVTTTGATLAEAKRALRAAGARAVHVVALAYS